MYTEFWQKLLSNAGCRGDTTHYWAKPFSLHFLIFSVGCCGHVTKLQVHKYLFPLSLLDSFAFYCLTQRSPVNLEVTWWRQSNTVERTWVPDWLELSLPWNYTLPACHGYPFALKVSKESTSVTLEPLYDWYLLVTAANVALINECKEIVPKLVMLADTAVQASVPGHYFRGHIWLP